MLNGRYSINCTLVFVYPAKVVLPPTHCGSPYHVAQYMYTQEILRMV